MDSVRRSVPHSLSYEVVVLANGVSQDLDPKVGDDPRIRVLQSPTNLGFGGGCNYATTQASGEHLVFLNDDATVEPGWLEALLRAADREPAGAVSSVLVTPDGRIEEAGRVLWSDGASHGIGSGLRASTAILPGVREVDCASACSMLVSRATWEMVGGFDERYFPAYYEDADLCLRLRLRGMAVLCASDSQVRHRRSASTSVLWRRFLGLRNHRALVDEWSSVLACHDPRPRDRPSLAEVEHSARAASVRRRAIHERFGMTHDLSRAARDERPDAKPPDDLLEREVAALRAELRLKDEYVAFLEANAPLWERGLQRQLDQERWKARTRQLIKRVPLLDDAIARLRHGTRHARNR